jgi:choline dehydrogenase-like flavoprotein
MILDPPLAPEQKCEVCIVGSGPIGMALALEFERLGRDVLVLESGGIKIDSGSSSASHARISDARRHAQMEVAVCRAFGGTSWTWGGRCVPFDQVDFATRTHVPHSGWPIRPDDVEPWYERAAGYLLCGDATFYSQPRLLPDLGADVSASFLERWSTQSRLALIHRERIERSVRIRVFLNSTVINLEMENRGRLVERVVVAGPGGEWTVRAQKVILAAGGIETTRLLLAVQRRWTDHFGGAGGPLGRYYMGHISGKIASIAFNSPTAVADFDFELDSTRTYVRRRFMLSASAQREHRLLNSAFWPDNPPFYDPFHRSSVLSAVFLALAVPSIGRRFLPEAIRVAHVGPKPWRVAAHVANVVLGAPRGARDILNILHGRFLARPRKPGFLVRNPQGRYALHYHSEQEPNPNSRVILTDETDRFGLPRVAIDLRFTEGDANSVIRSHEVLDSALRANAVGGLEYWGPRDQLQDLVLAQASDGFHQVGTTRMGRSQQDSVVDSNLKVHDIDNLYVASSSVFPTTGQANSTYLATALGIRLAHHLSLSSSGAEIKTEQSHQYALR